MTTKQQIREWLEAAKASGSTHVIVACDTFDHSDYPIFIKPDMDVRKEVAQRDGKNMQKIMEVYNLSMDVEQQLATGRAYNL